jgi:transposase-like protein
MKHEIICKHCKSKNVIKQGFRKNIFCDIQKYHCKKCGKVFSINSNFRMRYPKKIRELALKLNKEEKSLRQISKQIYKDTHVKVAHTSIMFWIKQGNKPYNYRWKKRCKICSEFIPKDIEHICKGNPGKKDGLYHCGKCKQYLPQESFNKDCTKKYGVMSCCKKCRKPILNRQNKIKFIIKKMDKINNTKI